MGMSSVSVNIPMYNEGFPMAEHFGKGGFRTWKPDTGYFRTT